MSNLQENRPDLGSIERCDRTLAPFTAESMRQVVKLSLLHPASEIRGAGVPPCLQAGTVSGVLDVLEALEATVGEGERAHVRWFKATISEGMQS